MFTVQNEYACKYLVHCLLAIHLMFIILFVSSFITIPVLTPTFCFLLSFDDRLFDDNFSYGLDCHNSIYLNLMWYIWFTLPVLPNNKIYCYVCVSNSVGRSRNIKTMGRTMINMFTNTLNLKCCINSELWSKRTNYEIMPVISVLFTVDQLQ